MRRTNSAGPARHGSRRWQQLAIGVAAVTLGAVPAAALAAVPAAAVTAPTAPPPVTILTAHAHNRNGDIFISPFGDASTYANGPEILSPAGKVLWFKPVPAGQEAADFRPQTYRGQLDRKSVV